ncbi:antitermination protein [Symbiopectobacterium purcellii]|uniref:Antitermination protein n=1 Tax=Symbiopectobacterium purcellii TaxID=2871826 RepID=A0ABX9AQ23_9ENTR|nr:antitermination protein [Symbiopectobacterium purcellii]QZN96436.1 antitermination protein [Symbiopectobacterium purcellii]
MATIIYRKSVNPVSKTNAAIRRHARRKAEAIRRELVTFRIDKALGQKPEKRKALNRIELAFKRKRTPRIYFGILARFRKQINHFAKMYDRVKRLSNLIWYSKPKTEYGITARASQTYTLRLDN